MKKYRLIKQYPGSLKLGAIATAIGGDDLWKGSIYYDKYPEYWEEVVEKDYEIISFTQDSGITDLWVEFENGWCRSYNGKPITNPYTTEEILSNKLYRIASVKRLSNGEVFTVGDRIEVSKYSPIETIAKIYISDGTTPFIAGIWLSYNSGSSHINTVTKAYPIFLTHDGKDIFPEDIVWYVNKENFYHDYIKAYPEVKFNSDIRAYFLTEEEAKKYIIENKPALSINEFWEITWMSTSGFNKHTYMKNLVKERLNLK